MKNQLIALSLIAMSLGIAQLPAHADFNLTFGRYDRHHDGRWSRRDFYDANRYYSYNHPSVVIRRRDVDRDFGRLDTDRDGFVTREEVRTYRDW